KQEAFEIEGKEPSARQLAGLIESARKEGVKAVFVQPQFSKKAARAIADSIGGVVVPVNPLPRDYLLELKSLAEKVRIAHTVPGSATGSGKEAVGNAR
ncbi:MAG TPA: zinc ABC transporter substrate-binding protein, partial [Deltaproteobacteria bacterium]|nr:zinc ABC transporter substrate-binding protein [Deltaproteobacteria bacterium]